MAFIGFGTFKIYYTYIFVLVVFKFLSDYIEGFNEKDYYNRYKKENFYDFGSILAYHPLFRNFMYFFAAIILGLILYIIYLKTEKDKEDIITLEKISSLRNQLFGLRNYSNFIDIVVTSFIYSLYILICKFFN